MKILFISLILFIACSFTGLQSQYTGKWISDGNPKSTLTFLPNGILEIDHSGQMYGYNIKGEEVLVDSPTFVNYRFEEKEINSKVYTFLIIDEYTLFVVLEHYATNSNDSMIMVKGVDFDSAYSLSGIFRKIKN